MFFRTKVCLVQRFVLMFRNQLYNCAIVWIGHDEVIKWKHFPRYWPFHSVESPSMVDPQWNIWYWGSKWNLHTVFWSAVGCEWGTTSVYFGITYVCFIPSRLPVFAVLAPVPTSIFFIFVKSIIWITHTKSSKMSCWFKIWMGFVGPILIKLWTSSIWGFL